MEINNAVKVIGAGLAGCEAAYFLAQRGFEVELYDIKPENRTPAHSQQNFAELVCSNSLKGEDVYSNASGLLKEEMRLMGSLVMDAAQHSKVPAGAALAVDRQVFSQYITNAIKTHRNITVICREVTSLNLDEPVIIATGPLTTSGFFSFIKKITGGELYFYDAAAPVIAFDSIDMQHAFYGERYKQTGDYINCPLDKDEYGALVSALISAQKAELRAFEKEVYFEGCMPVEALAARGEQTLRYGPLKPRGLDDPKTGRYPYACLQLRRENESGSMYNMVGFQTNLKFSEQKRVFSLIKALKDAEFLRYGVMHRNTYINSPGVLNFDYSMKKYPLIFFAGQITGVEGYVESASSGLIAAANMCLKLNAQNARQPGGASGALNLDGSTISGALCRHVSSENKNFQPMNANYGILAPLEQSVKDKKLKKRILSQRALDNINKMITGEVWTNLKVRP